MAARKWNLMGSRWFFCQWQSDRCRLPGWREMLHVNRNYHPDHPYYRFARWLQRRRRRSILRHRILWRRRPRPHYRDPLDPASARKDLTCWPNDRSSSPANAGDTVRRGASVKIAKFAGILDTPHSRSMTAVVIRPQRSFRRQLADRGLYR
jgi:hypothetical protein